MSSCPHRSLPSALPVLKGFQVTGPDWRRESEVKHPETYICSMDVRTSASAGLLYKPVPTPMYYFLIESRWLHAFWVLGSAQIWLQLCPDTKRHWLCLWTCSHEKETWVNKLSGSPQTFHRVPCSWGPCRSPTSGSFPLVSLDIALWVQVPSLPVFIYTITKDKNNNPFIWRSTSALWRMGVTSSTKVHIDIELYM